MWFFKGASLKCLWSIEYLRAFAGTMNVPDVPGQGSFGFGFPNCIIWLGCVLVIDWALWALGGRLKDS